MENLEHDQELFLSACRNGNHKTVRKYLNKNNNYANVAYDSVGSTPLMLAVEMGDVELTKLILEYGGDISKKSTCNINLLQKAIINNSPELLSTLLEQKPCLLTVGTLGQSPLMVALNNREIWVHESSDICTKVERRKSIRILDLILKYSLNSGNHQSYYEMCEAVVNNDIESVKSQLSGIEDVNFSQVKAELPLAFAVVCNHLVAAKILLESGMNPNADENLKRESLLFTCMRSGYLRQEKLEMLDLLLKFKANLQNNHFIYACNDKFYNCARILSKYIADVNCCDKNGATPFHIACEFADAETLKIMVEHGADLSKTKLGKSVLHLAAGNRQYGSFSYIANLVVNQGLLDVNVKDNDGLMPIDMPLIRCNNFLLLLKMGAGVNIHSVPDYAITHKHCGTERCAVDDYLQRLKLLGCKISQTRPLHDMASSDLDLCNEELEKLKNSVIGWNPRATLYNVLFMKRNEMTRFSVNQNLKQFFEECNKDFETKYPCFGSVLNVQYRRGLKRRDFLDLGKTSLAEVIGTRIPEAPSELIMGYMNNSELESFGNIKWDSL